jgi:hypothetical protein
MTTYTYLNPSPYPLQPLCAACGKWSVEHQGQLCCHDDKDDTWNCAEKSALFVAPFLGVSWPKEKSAHAEFVEGAR